MSARLTMSQGQIVGALVTHLSTSRGRAPTPSGRVVTITSQPWSSLTFTGDRHHLVLRLPNYCRGVVDGIDLDVAGKIIVVERATWLDMDAEVQLTADLLAIATILPLLEPRLAA